MQVKTNCRIEIEIQLTYLPNVYLFFFCSWKPIFLLIHKSWCSACQGQYTHSLQKLRLDPNLTPCKGVCIPESRWNTAQGIRNPSSADKNLESGTWNPESTAWNPDSRTVLVSFTWGEKFPVLRVCCYEKKEKVYHIILQGKLHSIDKWNNWHIIS